MRKVLILMLAAAAVGILLSRSGRRGPSRKLPGRGDAVVQATDTAGPAAVTRGGMQHAGEVAARKEGLSSSRADEAAGPAGPDERSKAAPSTPPAPGALLSAETAVDRPTASASGAASEAPSGGGESAAAPASSRMEDQLRTAASLLEKGKLPQARAILSRLYLRARGADARRLRGMLDKINARLVFDPRCMQGAQLYVVQPGDTLTAIGKKFHVNWRMIQRINRLSSDRLKAGQQLKILTGKTGALVVKSEFRMALLLDGVYVKEYAVGIGKDDRTPTGEFVVDTMLIHPPWTPPGGGIIRYGQEGYQLGERWIGFRDEPGASGLGIHGTNDDSSIGTKCSNGCIRLKNEDVIELFDFMQIGSRVRIVE